MLINTYFVNRWVFCNTGGVSNIGYYRAYFVTNANFWEKEAGNFSQFIGSVLTMFLLEKDAVLKWKHKLRVNSWVLWMLNVNMSLSDFFFAYLSAHFLVLGLRKQVWLFEPEKSQHEVSWKVYPFHSYLNENVASQQRQRIESINTWQVALCGKLQNISRVSYLWSSWLVVKKIPKLANTVWLRSVCMLLEKCIVKNKD